MFSFKKMFLCLTFERETGRDNMEAGTRLGKEAVLVDQCKAGATAAA